MRSQSRDFEKAETNEIDKQNLIKHDKITDQFFVYNIV